MTSGKKYEVSGSKETETEKLEFTKRIAKQILKNLIENKQEVTVEEVLFLEQWFKETGNYSEDAAVVVENWLQENDYQIFDSFAYYKDLMEAQPTR